MFLKILLVGAVVVATMVVVKDGRVLARAGLTGSCHQVSETAQGLTLQACSRGKLEGYPDLTPRSCTSTGLRSKVEYWRCPASVVSSQAPR